MIFMSKENNKKKIDNTSKTETFEKSKKIEIFQAKHPDTKRPNKKVVVNEQPKADANKEKDD